MPILAFPAEASALPTQADLQRLLPLPLTQLVVCGRSGSMFLHALLDGHPEILQIPHTLKFYDFLAANTDFGRLDGSSLARAFVELAVHQPLFDSDTSVLLKGRLGPELNTRVVVDKQAFVCAMAGLLPGNGHTGQQILCAVLLTPDMDVRLIMEGFVSLLTFFFMERREVVLLITRESLAGAEHL